MVPGEYLVCPFASVKPTVRVQSIPLASALVSPGLCHCCPLLLGAVPPFEVRFSIDSASDGTDSFLTILTNKCDLLDLRLLLYTFCDAKASQLNG